jgi:predicted DNA-binding transcriptional regulator YafY
MRIRAGLFPSVDELCRLFEIKPRTLYQDIRELKEKLGIDIRFNKARGGYYNAKPAKELPPFRLTSEEYLLLVIGQQMLVHYGGPSFDSLSSNALQKLIPERFGVSPRVVFEDEPSPISLKMFLRLIEACRQNSSIELVNNGDQRQVFTPESLVFERSRWFVRGSGTNNAKVSVRLASLSDSAQANDVQ